MTPEEIARIQKISKDLAGNPALLQTWKKLVEEMFPGMSKEEIEKELEVNYKQSLELAKQLQELVSKF